MGKHKEWRKLAKKTRRKRIRQKLAKERDLCEDKESCHEQSLNDGSLLEEQRKEEEFQAQQEELLAAEAEKRWLKAEEIAQKHWQELQFKLAAAREERAKQTLRIKEEWEREQKRLKEIQEKKEKEEEEKRKQQEDLQAQINEFVENGGNIPEGMQTKFETNPLKAICPFFQKTGACRFKDTCSRNHIRPGLSRVLLIPNFYTHYSLRQSESEYGNDFSLEYENQETYEHFKEFFYDVLPEMETCGHIKQFKVCCNHEIHLRGNVYVEYSSYREAVKGYQRFHSRWYGGKQLHVEFCNVESWKSAICGLFARQKCPKGTSCNFLHTFPNPGNLFAAADNDLHRTPVYDFEDDSAESEARHWRWSESPERTSTSHSRNSNHKHRMLRERDTHTKRRRRKSSSRRVHESSRYKKTPPLISRSNERQRSSSNSSKKRNKLNRLKR